MLKLSFSLLQLQSQFQCVRRHRGLGIGSSTQATCPLARETCDFRTSTWKRSSSEHVEEFEAVEEAQEIEYFEESDEDEPLIDYRSLRVCAGNFYFMGHFDTRLSRRTWDPCTSRHILQHPSTTEMFRTCFLEEHPALYQKTLERHRGQ